MNFKDLYKSANEDIKGDRALIDKIIIQSENQPKFRHKYASLCAAAILLIVCAAVYPEFHSQKSEDAKPKQNIVLNNEKAEHDAKKKLTEEKSADIIQKNIYSLTESKISDEHSDNVDSQTSLNHSLVMPDEVFGGEDNINDTDLTLENDDLQSQNQIESVDAISSPLSEETTVTEKSRLSRGVSGGSSGGASAGGGGSANSGSTAAISDEQTNNVKILTEHEYSQYLGFGISELIPDRVGDICFDIPDEVSVTYDSENGNITDDVFKIVGTSPDRPSAFVGIELTRLSRDAQNYFMNNSDFRKIINGRTTVVKYLGTRNIACFNYKNVWITISSVDVTEDEFDIILQSIIK